MAISLLTKVKMSGYSQLKRTMIRLAERHRFDPEDVACSNPQHTNSEVGCPDCYHPCQGCGEVFPCPDYLLIDEVLRDEPSNPGS